MIIKKHYNKINEPIKVSLVLFEINFMELAMLTLSLLVVMLLCGVVNVYADFFGLTFFLFLMLMYGPLIYLLSYANRRDHPQFLISWIAYHFFQPKRITFFNPQILSDGR